MSPLRNVRNWLDERLDWDDLIAPLRKKTVPLHRFSYWYFLGGITLFLVRDSSGDRDPAASLLPAGR